MGIACRTTPQIPKLAEAQVPYMKWHRVCIQPTHIFLNTLIISRLLIMPAAAKSLQSCPTLCNTMDGSPPGSPIPGILQSRTLERVAISFSNVWKWKVNVKILSRIRLLVTPWTAAYQAPPSRGFSRQEYWSGVPLPSPFISVWAHGYLFLCYGL